MDFIFRVACSGSLLPKLTGHNPRRTTVMIILHVSPRIFASSGVAFFTAVALSSGDGSALRVHLLVCQKTEALRTLHLLLAATGSGGAVQKLKCGGRPVRTFRARASAGRGVPQQLQPERVMVNRMLHADMKPLSV